MEISCNLLNNTVFLGWNEPFSWYNDKSTEMWRGIFLGRTLYLLPYALSKKALNEYTKDENTGGNYERTKYFLSYNTDLLP